MKKMRVYIQGGLGNQMFQFAFGKSLAQRSRRKLVLNLTFYNQSFDTVTTPREYELSKFENIKDIEIESKPITNLKKILSKISFFNFFKVAYEKSNRFCEKMFSETKLCDFVGYFQSEKYFVEIRDDILKDFHIPVENEDLKRLVHEIGVSNSVSVHIRRGDYVTNKAAASFHGLCGLDYYERAINLIKKKVEKPNFYFFSDDLEWVKENLKVENAEYVSQNVGPEWDMQLMKYCKHNIIANSSFSWWGAWLNENPDKIVIAPKQWFADSKLDTSDIIPEGWVKL